MKKNIKKNTPTPAQLLTALTAIPEIKERLRVIAQDVRSKVDLYRTIDPFNLAEALGAPDLDEWNRCTAVAIQPLEEIYKNGGGEPDEDINILDGEVSDDRFSEIVAATEAALKSKHLNFSFLSPDERQILEKTLAERQLQNDLDNGIGGIATCTVTDGEDELSFEGEIEDDGTILWLRTPYDERDGGVQDLSNCVVEEY